MCDGDRRRHNGSRGTSTQGCETWAGRSLRASLNSNQMNLSQRPAPTPGLAAGVLNYIVAKALPQKLLDLLEVRACLAAAHSDDPSPMSSLCVRNQMNFLSTVVRDLSPYGSDRAA